MPFLKLAVSIITYYYITVGNFKVKIIIFFYIIPQRKSIGFLLYDSFPRNYGCPILSDIPENLKLDACFI